MLLKFFLVVGGGGGWRFLGVRFCIYTHLQEASPEANCRLLRLQKAARIAIAQPSAVPLTAR